MMHPPHISNSQIKAATTGKTFIQGTGAATEHAIIPYTIQAGII